MPGSSSILYTKGQYLKKIGTLEGYVGGLKTILGEFEAKKKQISNFWDDNNGSKYAEIININIESCKTAIRNTEATITEYKGIIAQLDASNQAVGTLFENAESVARTYDTATDNATEIASSLLDVDIPFMGS